MKSSWSRRVGVFVLGGVLVSCGGDGGAPQSPVAPAPVAPDGGGYVMESSRGLAPDGFKLAMKLDPKPSEDGIIHTDSPVTVEVDLCGSTPDPGKTLHFLFDWDFNDLADVAGTGDTCLQKHTFRVPKDATKDVVLEANVCVTNGDPGVHNGSTYFSCRVVRVALPARPQGCPFEANAPAGCYPFQGSASFLWPGGPGPHTDVPYFGSNTTCSGMSDSDEEIFVAACSQEQASQLCDSFAEDLETPIGDGQLFECVFN